jgi:1,4-alpha-glucan branching enzyme
VAGLEEGERYRFRVRAENQYGLSEPLEKPDPVTAKYQFTVRSFMVHCRYRFFCFMKTFYRFFVL